ncbi:hypothetical protein M0R72_12375 [Candidatus Pacearchaeota archaeon]|nr:hypothetical protein [Candidatus Pacearchaeota archaeon]
MKFLTDGRSIWRDPASLKHRSEHPRNGHSEDTKRDLAEIMAYVIREGPCTRFDIELECHQTKRPVLLHLAALRKAGKIERYHDSYQVVTC